MCPHTTLYVSSYSFLLPFLPSSLPSAFPDSPPPHILPLLSHPLFSPSFLALLSLALRKNRAITSAEIIIVHRYHSFFCAILLRGSVLYITACHLFYCMGRRCDIFALLSGRGLVSALRQRFSWCHDILYSCFTSGLLHGPDLLNILAAVLT
jgi:hypothetical protein